MSKEMLAFLKMLHDQCTELLRDIKFDKHPQKDGYVVCMYASMIELSGGIIALVDRGLKTSLSPVFRTFLEAYVDFKNAIQDRSYVKHCYARHHRDWIKVLSSERPNPFLAAMLAHEESGAALQRHKRDLEKLKEEWFGPLKVHQRFDRADMADEYLSVYHFERDAIHNSWQALLGRHFEEADNGFGLALYKERPLDDYNSYLDSSAALLLDATDKIHERLKSGRQEKIMVLGKEFASIRAAENKSKQKLRVHPGIDPPNPVGEERRNST